MSHFVCATCGFESDFAGHCPTVSCDDMQLSECSCTDGNHDELMASVLADVDLAEYEDLESY